MPKMQGDSPAPLGKDGAPRRSAHLDPRTKLAAIAAMALAVALAPNAACELALMWLAFAFGCALGRGRASAAILILYMASVAAAQLVPALDSVALRTMLASFFLLVRKVFACGLMAYATVATTHANEFMSALARMNVPRAVTIPLAVALRYLPAVREDWGFIRDAMRMRGVSPSPAGFVRSPLRTIDCIYTPLLMSASRAADDLSMAAVARGIENPVARSCYLHIEMGGADYLVLMLCGCAVVCMLVVGAVL